MRYTPTAIQRFLGKHSLSGQSVGDFCAKHELKIPTFYAWRKKYASAQTPSAEEGFCQITPISEPAHRSLRLPSGLWVDLVGLSTKEIAELIVQIERADA